MSERLILDRLCSKVHLHNFTRQNTSGEWLFLNLDSVSLNGLRIELTKKADDAVYLVKQKDTYFT